MGVTAEVLVQVAYALGVGVLIGLERSMDDVRAIRAGALVTAEPPVVVQSAQPDAADLVAAEDPAAPSVDASAPADPAEPPASTAADADVAHDPVIDHLSGQLGVRTFAVLSLLGFIAALLAEQVAFIAPVLILAAALLVLGGYLRVADGRVGITTEVAAVGASGLGMLCHYNHSLAGVLALIVTAILASKRFTYGVIRQMRPVELNDTLKFLAAILIVLPLLPNRAIDPYQAFNPYKTGLLVVLISGISFAGYFLTRILGVQRGLGLAGVIGGLTSSTAVTAAMASQARQNPELRSICVFSAVAANATMFLRVLVVVAVLDLPLVKRLAWSVGGMTLVAALCTAGLWYRAGKQRQTSQPTELPLKNPFSVGPALKFGAFFVFIMFALKLARIYLGDQGLYVAAAVSGLADVDAITLSVSEQARDGLLARDIGAVAIIIAILSNSVTKTGIAIFSGGWQFGRLLGACLGAATLAGLVIALVM